MDATCGIFGNLACLFAGDPQSGFCLGFRFNTIPGHVPGLSLLGDPQKWLWFSFWFPIKHHRKGAEPPEKDTPPHPIGDALIGRPRATWASFAWLVLLAGLSGVILWTKSFPHHLKNHGMMIPLKIPTRSRSSALLNPFFGWEGSPTKRKTSWHPYSNLTNGGNSWS